MWRVCMCKLYVRQKMKDINAARLDIFLKNLLKSLLKKILLHAKDPVLRNFARFSRKTWRWSIRKIATKNCQVDKALLLYKKILPSSLSVWSLCASWRWRWNIQLYDWGVWSIQDRKHDLFDTPKANASASANGCIFLAPTCNRFSHEDVLRQLQLI